MRYFADMASGTAPTESTTLALGGFSLPRDRTLLMGVLNVTPDSFSDGGAFLSINDALTQARRLVDEGADILDVGGESTRPGAQPITVAEELQRVLPVIEGVVGRLNIPVSIDTRRPEVARACLQAGAVMVNDVTGLRDPKMASVVAEANAALTIMHMKGEPDSMANEAHYVDLIGEVRAYLVERAATARAAGIETVIIDPGIGFAKDLAQNLEVLRQLREFTGLGYPLLIGPSRKRFLGALTGREPMDRLEATLAAVAACVLNGADIVRVHDVEACRQAVIVADAIRNA
jgi:dihydropteroate synthase